jgi:hypothetical protein
MILRTAAPFIGVLGVSVVLMIGQRLLPSENEIRPLLDLMHRRTGAGNRQRGHGALERWRSSSSLLPRPVEASVIAQLQRGCRLLKLNPRAKSR